MNKCIRTFSLMSLIAITAIGAKAQEEGQTRTLFGNGKPLATDDFGFFVAPSFGLTQMDGSNASLFHLRAGIVHRDKLGVGGYVNTSLGQIFPQSETVPGVYMDYWTVGGFIEYTAWSKSMVHLTFPVHVGYGEVQMDNEAGDAGLGEANFFQIEPAALLEVNLLKHVRFAIGAGYRYVGDMTYRNFDGTDLSGVTGHVGLRIGLFR